MPRVKEILTLCEGNSPSNEDSLEVMFFPREDKYFGDRPVHFQIENPWSGDTENGFGATTSVCLTLDQVRQLIEYLENGIKNRK